MKSSSLKASYNIQILTLKCKEPSFILKGWRGMKRHGLLAWLTCFKKSTQSSAEWLIQLLDVYEMNSWWEPLWRIAYQVCSDIDLDFQRHAFHISGHWQRTGEQLLSDARSATTFGCHMGSKDYKEFWFPVSSLSKRIHSSLMSVHWTVAIQGGGKISSLYTDYKIKYLLRGDFLQWLLPGKISLTEY